MDTTPPSQIDDDARRAPPFSIRDARPDDSAAVRSIVAAVLAEYGLKFDPDGTDADLADIEGNYRKRGGVFRIVESTEGAPAGCGGLLPIDPATIELRKMYLLREARGLGLGKRLLADLLSQARRLGYQRVVLETNSVLHQAILLYRSFGFTPVARQHLSDRCDQAWELFLSTANKL